MSARSDGKGQNRPRHTRLVVAPVLAAALLLQGGANVTLLQRGGQICRGAVHSTVGQVSWIATALHCVFGGDQVCVDSTCVSLEGVRYVGTAKSDVAFFGVKLSGAPVAGPRGRVLLTTTGQHEIADDDCDGDAKSTYCKTLAGAADACWPEHMSCGLVGASDQACPDKRMTGPVCKTDSGSPVVDGSRVTGVLSGRGLELLNGNTSFRIFIGPLPAFDAKEATGCLTLQSLKISRCLKATLSDADSVGFINAKGRRSLVVGGVSIADDPFGPEAAGTIGHNWSGCPGWAWADGEGVDQSVPLTLLAFDHATSRWTRLDRDRRGCKSAPVKVSAGGALLFNTKSVGRRLFVTNTNILAYALESATAQDVPPPDLADLQEVTGLLASGLRAIAGVALERPGPASLVERAETSPARGPADALLLFLETLKKARDSHLARVKGRLSTSARLVSDLASTRLSLRAVIQDFETRGVFAHQPPMEAFGPRIAAEFTRLRETTSDRPETCRAPLKSLAHAIGLLLDAPHTGSSLQAAQSTLSDHLLAARMGATGACSGLSSGIDSIEGANLEIAWAPLDLADWRRARLEILRFDSAGSALDEVDHAVDDLIRKADDAQVAGGAVDAVLGRIDSCRGPEGWVAIPCLQTMELQEPWGDPPWDAQRNVSFKIGPWSPLGDFLVRAHPKEVEVKLEVTKRRFNIEASLGTIAALGETVRDRTWGPVTHPTATGKVISEISAKTRSGAPAATLTFQPLSWADSRLSPGLDLGAGVDPNRLFLALGASVKLGGFLRIGVAYAMHKTTQLAADQVAARLVTASPAASGERKTEIDGPYTRIESKDDIRTRDRAERGFQVTISIPLGRLNPFQKE